MAYEINMSEIIRCYVMENKSPNIRQLLLTPDQVALVKRVDKENLTSSALAEMVNISVQNASAKLNRLHYAGYIRMRERSAESGGIERVYYSREISRV